MGPRTVLEAVAREPSPQKAFDSSFLPSLPLAAGGGRAVPAGPVPKCLVDRARENRLAAGARLLTKATDAGTVERGGRTFRVAAIKKSRRATPRPA